MKKLMGLCFWIFLTPVFGEPLMVIPNKVWNEHSKIFLANCFVKLPFAQTLSVRTAEDKSATLLALAYAGPPESVVFEQLEGYVFFKVKNKNRSPQWFALSQYADGKSILHRIEANTQREVSTFALPFSADKGFLEISDVYYANDWHSVLFLTAHTKDYQKSALLAFDITHTERFLEPMDLFALPDGFQLTTKPVLIRLAHEGFWVVVGGLLNGAGMVWMFPFDRLTEPSRWRVGTSAISLITAVDLNQSGVVDRLYWGDKLHLWALDLQDLRHSSLHKLADVEVFSEPVVVRNAKHAGVRVYYLGKNREGAGLFMTEDTPGKNLKEGGQSTPTTPLLKGEYQEFFVRFGRLILVPKASETLPVVLDLPGHTVLSVAWQKLNGSPLPRSGEVVLSKLVWDAKQNQERLFMLDSQCELTTYIAPINQDQYGRMAWRYDMTGE